MSYPQQESCVTEVTFQYLTSAGNPSVNPIVKMGDPNQSSLSFFPSLCWPILYNVLRLMFMFDCFIPAKCFVWGGGGGGGGG